MEEEEELAVLEQHPEGSEIQPAEKPPARQMAALEQSRSLPAQSLESVQQKLRREKGEHQAGMRESTQQGCLEKKMQLEKRTVRVEAGAGEVVGAQGEQCWTGTGP